MRTFLALYVAHNKGICYSVGRGISQSLKITSTPQLEDKHGRLKPTDPDMCKKVDKDICLLGMHVFWNNVLSCCFFKFYFAMQNEINK